MQRIVQCVTRLQTTCRPVWGISRHQYMSSGAESSDQTPGEKKIIEILNTKFPGATHVNVSDISGGCGSMYEIQIVSEQFEGKRTVQQHRMVNEALKEEIKGMHGLRIQTAAPS